jgi:1,2-diacylglycerol 3-beta-galactosyltransferase
MPYKILILMADMGFGHRSAAKAISTAVQEQFADDCVVEIVNPLDHERVPAILRDAQQDYDRFVRELPEVYKLGYQVVGTPISQPILESLITALLYDPIRDILKKQQPDCIVVAFEWFLAPLDAVFAISRKYIPVHTVVTDLATVHRAWFHNVTELCHVPTQTVYDMALAAGLSPEKVRITGIPTHPRFSHETRTSSEIRAALGWHTELTTLLAVGSKRVNNLMPALHILNHSGLPIQLVVAAGGDDDLYAQLQAEEWHLPTQLYNFVEDMPAFMRASDVLICKAGGLTVTEALASGVPMILIDLIEGQETGNVEYVVNSGAGELAQTPSAVLEVAFHWLMNDCALLRERSQRAHNAGRPRAAYDIAAAAYQAAERGMQTKPLRIWSDLDVTALKDLFNRFNIPWLREEEAPADTAGR